MLPFKSLGWDLLVNGWLSVVVPLTCAPREIPGGILPLITPVVTGCCHSTGMLLPLCPFLIHGSPRIQGTSFALLCERLLSSSLPAPHRVLHKTQGEQQQGALRRDQPPTHRLLAQALPGNPISSLYGPICKIDNFKLAEFYILV